MIEIARPMFTLSKKEKVLFSFVLIAALTRLVPHPPNFAPITAMSLFAGGLFYTKAACLYRTALRHVDLRPFFGLLHHFDFCLFIICCDYMDGATKKQSDPKTGFTG